MSITDKKGINVTSGFKLISKQPIDARFIATDETDLQSLIDNGAVYDGLMVWVQSLGKYMSYNGTEFKELETGSGGSDIIVVDSLPTIIPIFNGTAVPNSGTVSKIYLNPFIDNSVESIFEQYTNALDQVTYIDLTAIGLTEYCYPVFVSNSYAIIIERISPSTKMFSIYVLDMLTQTPITVMNFFGVIDGSSEIVINEESLSEYYGISVGTENEKIKSIVSITEIEYTHNYDISKIYALKGTNGYDYYQYKGNKWILVGEDVATTVAKNVINSKTDNYLDENSSNLIQNNAVASAISNINSNVSSLTTDVRELKTDAAKNADIYAYFTEIFNYGVVDDDFVLNLEVGSSVEYEDSDILRWATSLGDKVLLHLYNNGLSYPIVANCLMNSNQTIDIIDSISYRRIYLDGTLIIPADTTIQTGIKSNGDGTISYNTKYFDKDTIMKVYLKLTDTEPYDSTTNSHYIVTVEDIIYTPVGESSGSGNVFEDVTELPDSPDSQKIYRISEPELYIYINDGLTSYSDLFATSGGTVNLISVNELPETPKNAFDTENMIMNIYVLDNSIYGYNISGDNQWISNNELAIAFDGLGYGGVITDDTTYVEGYVYLSYINPNYVNVNNSGTYKFVRDYELLATASLEITDTTSTYINFADVTLVKNNGDLKQDLKAVVKIKPADSDGFSTDLTCDVELNSLINSKTSNINIWNKVGSTFLGLSFGYVYIALISLSGTTSMANGIGIQLHLRDDNFSETNISTGTYTVELYAR